MHIRKIRKKDYEAVDRLLLQLHDVDVAGRPELFHAKDRFMSRDAFEHLIDNGDICAILAQQQGEIVGCCFSSTLDRSGMVEMKTAYIDLIVVDEQHWRQGIGKALFQAVEARAQKLGAKRIDLTVWSHNPIAMQAYEAYGMTQQRSVYEKRI